MSVLGTDQSATSSGICILDSQGKIKHKTLITPPPSLREGPRLEYIYSTLEQILIAHPDVELAAMEGYSYDSVNKKFVLGEVGGVVKLLLCKRNIPVLVVAPKQLKKFVTGFGSASKDQVQYSIREKWGEVILQNDEADAYGLARIAYTSLLKNTTRRNELDVLKILHEKPLRKAKRRSKLTGLSNSL